ncbi:CdsG family type III secretion system protein [Simkania negevensis]|uniref:Putative SctF chaperone SctG n=1 Tax=Simkania negevensis (strain ATCC VR-1471 / DSM 27360 / Z) TaxID=331113 RepID=F8L3L6_SIMNZ|nr:SctF chaperone SctG [Simkania negevensis]CCB89875.1 putative SctF chaperone SctG [Simkania negevensis Z]
MEDLKKYEEDFFLFLEAGFIAINQADEDSAVKLLKTCELMQPENPLIKIGFGYLHLHKLELKQACEYFEEVLRIDPGNEMATTFLGIALSLTPDKVSKGEQLLEKSARDSSDSQVKKVANTTLDFVEQFVKKTPGPADVKRK